MVTGAALATVNRLPVLLIPGDVFASRKPDPVLQQLEVLWEGDTSVNDCFRPVSRSFDRISRPEQVLSAAMARRLSWRWGHSSPWHLSYSCALGCARLDRASHPRGGGSPVVARTDTNFLPIFYPFELTSHDLRWSGTA